MILRWFFSALLLILVSLGGAYFYFFYISTPVKPSLNGEFKQAELTINGERRTFSYYVPQTFVSKPLSSNPAIVFVLHGSRGTGSDIRNKTAYEFDRLADSEGFAVVYPDGYEKHWNDCRMSAQYAANTENIDDPLFFDHMFEYFIKNYGVDAQRIFVSGYSNGGHMGFRLAFEMPEKVAAIAAMAANLPIDENLDCEKKNKPVSVAIFNGTEDPVNPYAGGLVELFGNTSRGTVLSSLESAKYWVELASLERDGQTKVYSEQDGDPDTHVSSMRWGHEGVQVRLYTLQGSGHIVPSKKVQYGRFFGGNGGDIEAAEAIWQFFSDVQ